MANTFQTRSPNSIPEAGFWTERDTAFLRIRSTADTFAEPFTEPGPTAAVLDILQSRGTIIAFNTYWDGGPSELHVILGSSSGNFEVGTATSGTSTPVLDELKAEIDAFLEPPNSVSATVEIGVFDKLFVNSQEAPPTVT